MSALVLEGYRCVKVSLCSLCGFNIFGVRAQFSMNACHLFCQHVSAIIPFIGLCRRGWCLSQGSPQWWHLLCTPVTAIAMAMTPT